MNLPEGAKLFLWLAAAGWWSTRNISHDRAVWLAHPEVSDVLCALGFLPGPYSLTGAAARWLADGTEHLGCSDDSLHPCCGPWQRALQRVSFSPMAVVLASVIAVLGTLAGATAGYLFQQRIADRSEATARDERLRQERLVACSAFAGAVMDLRRAQYDRWYRRHEHPQQADPEDARAESYRLRSVAWSAFYRFRLTTANAELTNLGWSAVEEAAHVAKGADENDLRERGERARALLEDFVTAAAQQFNETGNQTSSTRSELSPAGTATARNSSRPSL